MTPAEARGDTLLSVSDRRPVINDDRATPELLDRLLDEHGAALELFAAQWTSAPEDCVQEALLSLVRQRRLPRRVVPWLYRVVRNRAISMRRQADRRTRHEHAAAATRPLWFRPPASMAGWDADTLSAALESLEEEWRELVVARIWGGLSFEQLAEVTGTSRSTAHRRYEEGLARLRTRLEAAEPAPCRLAFPKDRAADRP